MASVSAAEAPESPLVAERVGRRYRRSRPWALRNVTFAVPSTSVTALVGPNGAGKSTLLRACVGFERPDEGRMAVCGHDVVRDRRRAVESVGYVPQSSALYRGLTIADHMTMAVAARDRFDVTFMRTLMEQAALDVDRAIGDLSGGERAKVSLALALGCRPPVLLLDEPLASLDPLARRDFLTMLGAYVREQATTVLLSSHIVTDVEQACDRVLVLSAGRLALDTDIDAARRTYRTSPAEKVDGRAAVGVFAGPDGSALALHADQAAGRPASLEEIALGFLAARPGGEVVDA